MTPIDIQVSRSKVKVKGHASLLHIQQLITQERFAPEASNLVGRQSFMSKSPLLIFRSEGRRSCQSTSPPATDNSTMLCPRSLKRGKKIVLDE